jgi:hypothetical protein
MENVDLLSDEGSTMQQELWNLCFREKLQSADPKDHAFYESLRQTSKDNTAETAITSLRERYEQRGYTTHAPEISNLMNILKPFVAVVSIMAQANVVAALVWSSTVILFEVSQDI